MKLTKVLALFLILFTGSFIYSLAINEKEIKKIKPIRFNNYKGYKKNRSTFEQVHNIGVSLSKKSIVKNKQYYYRNKYSIVRATSQNEKQKFSADILTIHKNAKVTHVGAIRIILSGYLQNKFKYNYDDAFTVATFITYYNAVYRKNIKYYTSKYKSTVLKHINNKNAGLSVNYYNWAGKTKIIIPLTDKEINTTVITDKKVIEKLKKKKNKGIEERKKIITIKKKEVNKKKEKIVRKKKEIKKEKEKINKRKKEIKKIKDPKKKEEEKKKIIRRENKIKKEEKQIKKDEKVVIKKENEIKKDEKDLKKDKKIVEYKKDPKKLIKDIEDFKKKEKELKKKEDDIRNTNPGDNVFRGKLYYLKINQYITNGHYNNTMFLINPKTRKFVKESSLKHICGKKYDIFNKGVVVIAHKSGHDSKHYLVLLDTNTIEPIAYGKKEIFWRSFVEVRNNTIYAIIKKDIKYYLGKFDQNLKLIASSQVAIQKDSFISFFEDTIYINKENGQIMILNKSNLKNAGTITK